MSATAPCSFPTRVKAGNDITFTNTQLAQPFVNFLDRTRERQVEFRKIRARLEEFIEEDLHVTSAYRPVPGFLPLPLQKGINVFTRRQGPPRHRTTGVAG